MLLNNPVMVARSWAHAGFSRLHLFDSDADGGSGSNSTLVENVIRDGALEVQACGGVQSDDDIERLVDAGARWIVVGSRGVDEPNWLATAAELFPGVLIVTTQIGRRRLETRGWVRNVPHDIFDLVADLRGLPLAAILVSMVGGTGPRTAIDLSLIEDVADSCELPLMTSGGVSTMDDLRALEHRGVFAAVLDDGLCVGGLAASALDDGALDGGALNARSIVQEFGS